VNRKDWASHQPSFIINREWIVYFHIFQFYSEKSSHFGLVNESTGEVKLDWVNNPSSKKMLIISKCINELNVWKKTRMKRVD
jgi:hypothetical protein